MTKKQTTEQDVPIESTPIYISTVETDFGRIDLNELRDKLNEIITILNGN